MSAIISSYLAILASIRCRRLAADRTAVAATYLSLSVAAKTRRTSSSLLNASVAAKTRRTSSSLPQALYVRYMRHNVVWCHASGSMLWQGRRGAPRRRCHTPERASVGRVVPRDRLYPVTLLIWRKYAHTARSVSPAQPILYLSACT